MSGDEIVCTYGCFAISPPINLEVRSIYPDSSHSKEGLRSYSLGLRNLHQSDRVQLSRSYNYCFQKRRSSL